MTSFILFGEKHGINKINLSIFKIKLGCVEKKLPMGKHQGPVRTDREELSPDSETVFQEKEF